MKAVRNPGSLDAAAIEELADFLHKSPEAAVARNQRKDQSLFAANVQGRPLIAKQYFHRALKHRMASFCGHGNADRYYSIAVYLRERGLPAPAPFLLLKSGRGLLPDRSLYVMEAVEGDMLYPQLPALEADPERLAIVARKVAELIIKLREVGVIHRDLNTKNFLLSPENRIHLIDFDHASRHRKQSHDFFRRHQRDIETFLSTCGDAPKLAEAVQSLLG